jgi:acyl carrier protein
MTHTAATLDAVTLRIRELLAELLQTDPSTIHGGDSILGDKDSDGLGLDSLDVLKLALALADEFDLKEPTEIDWQTVNTVADAAALVHRLAAGSQPQFT